MKRLLLVLVVILQFNGFGYSQAQTRHKDHSRMVSLGIYVGATGQPDFDWQNLFQELYNSNFNFVSLHGLSPWNNVGFYPWAYDSRSGLFDTTKPNEAWWNHIAQMLEQAALNDIGIEWCFFDAYGTVKWRNTPGYPFKKHPFVENTRRKNLVGDSSKSLYEGSIPGELETDLIAYVQRFIALAASIAKKYPQTTRIYYRVFNEPLIVLANRKEDIDFAKSLRQDDRLSAKIRALWTAAGFKEGDFFREVRNEAIAFPDRSICYPCMYDYWQREPQKLLEIHGIQSVRDVKKYLAAGIRADGVIWSSDGAKEDARYFNRLKAIEQMKLPYVDYKIVPGDGKWNTVDLNENFSHSWTKMKTIFDGRRDSGLN